MTLHGEGQAVKYNNFTMNKGQQDKGKIASVVIVKC